MICRGCGDDKSVDLFYNKDTKCKECRKEIVRNRYKDSPHKYDYSEKGVIRVIHKTQVRHARLRKSYINYTKDELKYWLYENGFKEFYDKWAASGHKKDSKPSVDRLDTLKGYEFNNIRLVTWKDNRDAQYDDVRNAKGAGGRRCKRVSQCRIDGSIIATFDSQNIAMKKTGVSNKAISSCCTGKIKTAGGFVWKLK